MRRLIIFLIIVFVIIFSAFVYFFYNYQFWTHLNTTNFKSLIEYSGSNIKGFRGKQILIHKNFSPHIIRIENYARSNEVTLIINQSYRFNGQMINRSVVNPSKKSNHQSGFAIDFNVVFNRKKYFSNDLKRGNLMKLPENVQDFINLIRKDENLRWGGDFNKEDPIHIDNPLYIRNTKLWKAYSKECYDDFSRGIAKWKTWKNV